jgi:phosphoglycerate dehydrogenase-like enzyme
VIPCITQTKAEARAELEGYPFLDLPNVIGSPHNSAGGGAWRDEYLRRAVQNCRRAILGETPRNLIGPDERML